METSKEGEVETACSMPREVREQDGFKRQGKMGVQGPRGRSASLMPPLAYSKCLNDSYRSRACPPAKLGSCNLKELLEGVLVPPGVYTRTISEGSKERLGRGTDLLHRVDLQSG